MDANKKSKLKGQLVAAIRRLTGIVTRRSEVCVELQRKADRYYKTGHAEMFEAYQSAIAKHQDVMARVEGERLTYMRALHRL